MIPRVHIGWNSIILFYGTNIFTKFCFIEKEKENKIEYDEYFLTSIYY